MAHREKYSVTIDAEEMQRLDSARGMIPRSPVIEALVRLANRDAETMRKALGGVEE